VTKGLLLRLFPPLSLWLLLYHESIFDIIAVWNQSKTYEHGFLIIPVCLWLVWHEKEKSKNIPLSTSWPPILLLFIPCLLWLIGRIAGIALFEHISAILSLQLVIWAMIGNPLARTFFFPIFYLIFCIPFGEELVPYLQSITADIAVSAVRWTGVPIYRDGLFLTIPNGQFEVAEACSGIRFLISSIALGTLFTHLFFVKWWKRLLFIVFSCTFPIIANGIRAYGIIIIGYFSNMTLASGADHLIYGWVFFALIILITFFLAIKFSDKPNGISEPSSTYHIKESKCRVVSVMFSLLIIFLVSGLWEKSISGYQQQTASLIKLPNQISEMDDSSVDQMKWGISFPQAEQKFHGITLGNTAELYTARYSMNQDKGELISFQNQLYDKNIWTLRSYKKALIHNMNNDIQLTQLDVVNSNEEQLRILYWYCMDDYCSNNKLKLKLYKAFHLLSGKMGYAEVKAVASSTLTVDELFLLAKDWISKDSIRK